MTVTHLPIASEVRRGSHESPWLGVFWKLGRWFAFAATLVLLVGLFQLPKLTLDILWGLLIPVLPASFFITPQWWRGICPLATTNQWFGSRLGKTGLSGAWLEAANALGIALLLILVPARHLVFNENGPLLGITIAAIIVAAAALGLRYNVRAGFCNAICPVLPVERLYGQHPLIRLDNHRCHPCGHCISKGCLEVDQTKSIQYAVRPAHGSTNWLTTIYGIFAASMPGFIVGYFTMQDIPAAELDIFSAAQVYGWIAACSVGSYFATLLMVRLSGINTQKSLAYLAATAGILYYWWGAPLLVRTLQLPTIAEWPARIAFFLLILYWLIHALKKSKQRLPN